MFHIILTLCPELYRSDRQQSRRLASDRVHEDARRAWEAHDNQDAAHGDGNPDPDPDDPRQPSQVGESMTARGEGITDRDGPEEDRHDTGPQGESQRPTGTSTAEDSTSVDPQDPSTPIPPT